MKSSSKLSIKVEDVKSGITRLLSDKRRLGRTILILLILILALVIRIMNLDRAVKQEESNLADSIKDYAVEMYVDISGEVNKPGVYLVEDGTRLYEVIEKAGGLTDKANTNQINQAGYVEDGEKIIIPSINEAVNANSATNSSPENSKVDVKKGLININTASKEDLMSITGVGEVIATRIIEYRKIKRFTSLEDIMNVNGIGSATYEKMKSEITV